MQNCIHYERKCQIIAPCCNKIFSCRICHDEDSTHKINRYNITHVICKNCETIQPIKQYCEKCNICFGNYYCDICHLFDDTDKGQYHCDKCNICRVGGINNNTHCDTCNTCIQNNIEHKCFSIKDSVCPICMEDLFSSISSIVQMKCCHFIHKECLLELIETSYKCPLCTQSLANTNLMDTYIDNEILNTPMPEEYNYNVKILCNDCHVESQNKIPHIWFKMYVMWLL